MMKLLRSIKTNKSGASAAEYALILAVVGGAIAVAAVNLGGVVSNSIQGTANDIASPPAGDVTATPSTTGGTGG